MFPNGVENQENYKTHININVLDVFLDLNLLEVIDDWVVTLGIDGNLFAVEVDVKEI